MEKNRFQNKFTIRYEGYDESRQIPHEMFEYI